MDRNREARRAAASMAAAPNGLSRRRHRSSSLRDSPEENGQVELQEPGRLRDRGIKKDRERDRDRDKERERSSRSCKRRRGERLMNAGDDSSEEESVNDEEEDDDEDVDVAGAFTRMLPPLPNPVVSAAAAPPPPSISTNHNHSHNHNHNNHHHHQHRKSFPPSIAAKVFKAAPPAWKAADEMIGVSVPRKARSVSTKRSHDWVSGGGGEQMIHRQVSTSPVRQGIVSSTPSPAAVRDAPLSPPSSSNASVRKKIKPNGGGSKPRPLPKSSTTSKSSSSNNNPEDLEIEIAEVLYGLMTQSQAPSKNDSTSKDAKSRVSSPVSNSSPSAAILPQNSSSSAAPLSAVAPKRKRPRQVPENNIGCFARSSAMMKVEVDQTPKTETPCPNLERNSGSAAENGDLANLANSLAEANDQPQQQPPDSMKLEASVLSESKGALTEEAGESRDVVLPTKEEVNFLKKESTAVSLDDNREHMTVTSTVTATEVNTAVSEMESKKEEKFQIDLMAPPPQLRASPEREGEVDFVVDKKRMVFDMEKREEMMKDKEDDKEEKVAQSDDKRAKPIIDAVELQKTHLNKERNVDLQFDLEKPDRDNFHKSHHHHTLKSQSQSLKVTSSEEPTHTDRTAQPSSLPLPMSVASWPGGLPPPMGYMAPLQGVVSMDPSAMSSAPIQPLFSQPRPKRCATHCHIARNIHYYQQLMKMNPFWPTAGGGSAPMFGAKPCNLNVMPSAELHGNVAGSSVNFVQDKGQGISIFPGHAGKDKVPQAANIPDSAHRKQQILLQQALPPVAPNNILHGPAFIFPFTQQQAAVAAASSRLGSLKSPSTTSSLASTGAHSSSTMSASATAPAAATALSFNYPNMSANETQYVLLQNIQNNPYAYPIPAVGAPPNFRGAHAQAMTMFNGPYYSSQMIHPSHLPQQQPPPSQPQQIQQSHQHTSSGSSSSQKHLQNQQQRQQGSAINGGTGNGNLHNFPAPKNRSSQQLPQHPNQHITPPQACQLESEVGGEDSPSTADSRVSRATMPIHPQNFAMPIHPQNFALMTSPAAMTGATAASGNGNQNDKKQQHQYQQQQGFKGGVDIMPPQTFAMSFGPINGSATASGIDISSMAQNHAILQSLPEVVTRQSCYQIMQAAQVAPQKKDSRMTEDGKSGVGSLSNADEESKVSVGKAQTTGGGQSITFSRPDFTDASGSTLPGNGVVDSSARTLNLSSGPTRTTHSPMPNVMGTTGAPNNEPSIQAQLKYYVQQQKINKMQEQNEQRRQQNLLAASAASRSKTPATSNGSAYSEHLTSSSSIVAKLPNALSGFPQHFVQNSNTSNNQAQSPQWKNSTRTPASQGQSSLASSTSSLKNHPQQQTRTQQSHTQISFGANQKPSASQGQQPPNGSQSPSPLLVVGSPTHSSISKGASGSPRTTTVSTNNKNSHSQASTLSSQQAKNSPSISSQKSSPAGGRNVPSILGNPHIASSSNTGTKTQQQQQQQQTLQQAQAAQLFYSNPYLQAQPPHSTSLNASAAGGGYYLQRRRSEQQQQQFQQPQGSSASSSTGMLSLCPPVTVSNTSTTDPAKAVAAAACNMKGGGLSTQSILHAAHFAAQSSGNPHQLLPAGFSYVHGAPAAVQVKPAEQKQPAGNDNLHAFWQPPEKK